MNRSCRLVIRLALLFLTLSASPLRADSLQGVVKLARAGAGELALQEMDARQPAFETDPVGWIRWEQERLFILQLHKDWPAIVARIRNAPEAIPASLDQEFASIRAEAELELQHAGAARDLLRRALWQKASDTSEERLQQWRRLLVRSYLQDGMIVDAQRAMRRYQQDYSDASAQWFELASEVLLRAGRHAQVLELLEGVTDARLQPLRWLARLHDQPDSAAAIIGEIDPSLQETEDEDQRQRARLWAVRAQASARLQAFQDQVSALESGLAQGEPLDPALFQLTGEALWGAYLAWGERLGNARQMLIGQDERWYFAATESMETTPLEARALFAVLAMQGQSAARRGLGHEYLAKLVLNQKGGRHLLYALYLGNSHFPGIADIPVPVRYLLVDAALERQDLATASALMEGLEAPSEEERFAWQLRRARIMILTGEVEAGTQILKALLQNQADWKPDSLDRLLQVVFDLQRIDEHARAIDLLGRIDTAGLALQQHRELLFWLAESHAALDQQRPAAAYFLQSAILADAYAMDPWAQTARYHAAQALAAAGLRADAANLLEGLLRVTRDSNRRAVLRHELQQLENGQNNADR